MTPKRPAECLNVIRWQGEVLAEAIDVPSHTVGGWLAGAVPAPRKVGAWLEALGFVHEAAEETKPATAGGGFGDGRSQEFIPVYVYDLLRNVSRGPATLAALFGSDDEGAVFFLVTRGLATREEGELVITDAGRAVGFMTA